jgi:drug/metabolite transporter (DMT)-like permease
MNVPMTRLQASLLVLIAAVVWGVAFYFQKAAMDHVGPASFIAVRALLAALTLAPFALWEQRRGAPWSTELLSAKPLRYALQGGVIFCFAGYTQQVGLGTATVTNAGFLTALYVVITPFLVWMMYQKRPAAMVWLATLVAFLGIWFLGGGSLQGFSTGDRFVALSAFGWSLFMVNVAASGRLARPIQMTCLTFACGSVLSFAVALVFEQIAWHAMVEAAVPIIYVGVFGSALTYVLMAIAMRHIPATHATILLSTETLFAAAAGHVMLGERLSVIGWLGAGLVLAAVVLIQWKPAGR